MPEKDDDTVDEIPAYQPAHAEATEMICDGNIEIAALTHPGLVREKNEDHYAVLRRHRSSSVLASSLPDAQLPDKENVTNWLMVVADGLGGHASGEIASATAISTILKLSNEVGSWLMRPEPGVLEERVQLYADTIQASMSDRAQENPSYTGMATTIAAVYVFGEEALVVNVGDSRTYLCRDNEIEQVSIDHTLARHMQEEGVSEESSAHFNNLVTRTFNTDGKEVEFDLFQINLQPGDHILLCSDGLTDMVNDDQILAAISSSTSTDDACHQLLQAALAAGGRDNVTTVLVKINDSAAQ